MINISPARWRIEKRTLAVFGLAALFLLVIGTISYRTIRELADSNAQIAQSHRVLERLFELNLDLDDVESAARNFVITGDTAYLTLFDSASAGFRDALSDVQSLVVLNWSQRQRIERIRPLFEHRLVQAQRMIRLRRSLGEAAAAKVFESGYGDEVVPEIRAGIKDMESAQNELLVDLDSRAQRSAARTIASLGVGSLMVVFVLAVAAFINHRDMSRLRKADQALRQSQTTFQDFLDYANDLIYSVSSEGKFLYVNRKWKETLDYHDDDLKRLSSLDIVHPDYREQARSIFDQLARGAVIDMFETVFMTRSGRSVLVSGNMNSRLENGRVVATRCIFRDVTDKRQSDEALQRSNDVLLRSVQELEQRTEEITRLSEMVDLLQSCRSVEEAYAVIARSVPKIIPAAPGALGIISSSRNLAEIVATWGNAGLGERVFAPEDCWALRRGRTHFVEGAQSVPVCPHLGNDRPDDYMCLPLIAQGEAIGLLHIQWQPNEAKERARISEAKKRLSATMGESIALALANLRLREVLSQQSIRDPLTGLFNRRYMEESLERELRRAVRSSRPLGVLMMDLDQFKRFNDSFGHDAGDKLLREFGAILRSGIRGGDISCRYGGEEFALILPEATLEATMVRAEQLRESTRNLSVNYHGQSLGVVTVSIGVAGFPEHGTSSEILLQAADKALYRAKAQGRDQVAVAGPKTAALQPHLVNPELR